MRPAEWVEPSENRHDPGRQRTTLSLLCSSTDMTLQCIIAHMTSDLPPRRAAFVQAYADPTSATFGNGTQSAIAAGFSDGPSARVAAVRTLASDSVQSSIRATLERAGVTQDKLARGMLRFFEDDDKRVRASSVRAGEILMRASGMLEAETNVSIDARSVILPSASSADISALESLLAQIGGDSESNPP